MPDVDANLDLWGRSYDWDEGGDEWSANWGGTKLLWWGVLRPRVHAFLPTATILEIAPGYGRCTQFLKDVCDDLIVVDLSEGCIDACRERFESSDNISYHVNDGYSLAAIPDASVDFAFSFDSLVHAEMDVISAYLEGLASKLRPDGIAFIHHSNLGAYRMVMRLAELPPERLRHRLVRRGVLPDPLAWRGQTVTAELVESECRRVGLECVGQELINWGSGRQLIDCFSVVTPQGSRWQRPLRRVRNPRFFKEEARSIRRLGSLYAEA